MSWMEKLFETYENNEAEHMGNLEESTPLLPICHSEQSAHVHVVLDGEGNFREADVVLKKQASGVIPITEGSAGRAGAKIAPHPLFDKLQYIASDYVERGGEKKKAGFEPYLEQLNGWCDSEHGHSKVKAVRDYLSKGTLITDLIECGVFHADEEGKLLRKWTDKETPAPEIFGVIPSKDQREAFVRFSVMGDDLHTELWTDKSAWKSWIDYHLGAEKSNEGLCFVTGEQKSLAVNHPKRIRFGGDGAKLISSNDTSGFTFRGKFDKPSEVYGVGFEVTQKAHNALRWLLARQGVTDNGLAVVAWSPSGKEVPSPDSGLDALLDEEPQDESTEIDAAAQTLARRFAKKMKGYRAELTDTDQVVVMAMDSATPGRMAIKYYRELTGSEYLERIEHWHTECSWMQRYGKGKRFEGPPSPRMIVQAAYGGRADDKLRKATIERLLPCIIDSVPIHRDLVQSCVRRACNRVGQEPWEWETCLGVACALYRYHRKKEGFTMVLDTNRPNRDYLYGRLLALADNLERSALTDSEKNRSTNAARLMQRFSDRPFSTWKIIQEALEPYRLRLQANHPTWVSRFDKKLDQVMDLFDHDEFISDSPPLSGEYLIGFSNQRSALYKSDEKNGTDTKADTE